MRFFIFCFFFLKASFASGRFECESLFSAEQRQQIEAYQDGAFKDELQFEDRFQEFLDIIPDSVLRALGVSPVLAVQHRTDPEQDRHLKTCLGDKWELIDEWLKCAEASFMCLTPEDWAVVEPYLLDEEFWHFLGSALAVLPIHPKPTPHVLWPATVQQHLHTFLRKHRQEVPAADDLLAGSRLFRETFAMVAGTPKKPAKIDLTKASQRQFVLHQLRSHKLRLSEKAFQLEWMYRSIVHYRDEMLRARIIDNEPDNLYESMARYHALWETDGLLARRHAVFLTGLFFHVQAPDQSFTGEQIRQVLENALREHHRLLVDLVQPSEAPQSEVAFTYRPFVKESPPPPSDESNLETYLTKEAPALKPGVEYIARFRRDFGHRQNWRRVIFTERALSLIQYYSEQVSLKDWLHALTLGMAAEHGNNGLKLLQHSPFRSLPHLRIEVKVLKSPLRLYGNWSADRFEFDYVGTDH